MNDNHLEEWKRYLPHFLNKEDRDALYSELRRFPDNFNYYGKAPDEDPLQGDAWKPFRFVELTTGNTREVTGIIISNSCDIVPSNSVDGGQNVLFAPLMRLDLMSERLRKANKSQDQINNTLNTIRKQEKTDILYLPALANELPESFVRLDEVRPYPVSLFREVQKKRVFTLSQYGFYVLLIKLAIHFTRVQERVRRSITPT
jgi:hypothetical protein